MQRQASPSAEVRRHLPDATDPASKSAVAPAWGMDMRGMSWPEEVRPVSTVLLADEMALTNLEIQLNAPRPVAMRHMADRTGAPELLSLVAVLIQSERFGTRHRGRPPLFATILARRAQSEGRGSRRRR